MSTTAPPVDAPAPVPPGRHAPPAGAGDAPKGGDRRYSPLVVAGLVLLAIVVGVALAAPLLSRYSPKAISGPSYSQPSARHWLGTDDSGRDLFAQLVYGARASLFVAVVAGSLAMVGAVLLGVLPAVAGGATDTVCNRVVVFLLALPAAPLLIMIGAMAGNQRVAIILVIGFLGVAPTARLLRARTISLRQRGFIASARGFGSGPLYLTRRHLVPSLGPLLVVRFVNWAGVAVGLEAGLAFLGLGNPSSISWGMTMNRALSQQAVYFSPLWTWWALPPGFAVTITILGFVFLGVGLEPTFNPRWLANA
ncbi:MAG: ABC transporter permease [Acidimicrobiales bacterium]